MTATPSPDSPQKSNAWVSSGVIAVLGLVSLAAGLFVGIMLAQNITTVLKMRGWPVADARVLDATLSTYRGTGSHGGSTTYAVKTRYEYMWQGQRYEGTRVGVEPGSDNIGSAHSDRLAILQKHLDTNTPMPCRVDPSNPSRAVLFPELRPELAVFMAMFAIICSGAGLGVIIFAFGRISGKRSARERLAAYPDQPWLARKEWSTMSIPCGEQRYKRWFLTVFAVFWNLASWFMVFSVLQAKNKWLMSWPGMIFWAFPLIGIAVAVAAVLEHLRYFRFGNVRFEIPSGPGRIAGEFMGSIRIPVQIDSSAAVEIQLTCQRVREAEARGREIRSPEEALSVLKDGFSPSRAKYYPNELIWSADLPQPMSHLGGDGGARIPVRFEIPADLPPSTIEQQGDGDIAWKLYVRVKTSGPDLFATFEVPVLGS